MRELDNLLQRALILVNGPVIRPEHIQFELANDAAGMTGGSITVAHLPVRSVAKSTPATIVSAATSDSAAAGSLANSLGQAERDLILDALRSPRTLRYKLARLREAGIDVPAA